MVPFHALVKGLIHLETLGITRGTFIDEGSQSLTPCSNSCITHMCLREITIVRDESHSFFSKAVDLSKLEFPVLQVLHMSHAQLGNIHLAELCQKLLAKCPMLTHLAFEGNSVSEISPVVFETLTSLRVWHIDLSGSPILNHATTASLELWQLVNQCKQLGFLGYLRIGKDRMKMQFALDA